MSSKRIIVLLPFCIASLYADKNWIPIQPIPFDTSTKLERNISKPPANAVETLKRLQRLMDKQTQADALKKDTAKNCYLFEEPAEN